MIRKYSAFWLACRRAGRVQQMRDLLKLVSCLPDDSLAGLNTRLQIQQNRSLRRQSFRECMEVAP